LSNNEYRMSKKEGYEALALYLNTHEFQRPRSVTSVTIEEVTGDFICALGAEKKKRVRKARPPRATEQET